MSSPDRAALKVKSSQQQNINEAVVVKSASSSSSSSSSSGATSSSSSSGNGNGNGVLPITNTTRKAGTIKAKKIRAAKNRNGPPKKDVIEQLKIDLSKNTRLSNRDAVIRTVMSCPKLQDLSLESASYDAINTTPEQFKEMEYEVCRSTIRINGIILRPHHFSATEVTRVLRQVVNTICDGDNGPASDGYDENDNSKNRNNSGEDDLGNKKKLTSNGLYQALISRLAQTSGSADAYFALNTLLGSQDLILQPTTSKMQKDDDNNNNKAKNEDDVIDTTSNLILFCEGGNVHVTLTTYHKFGLFRKNDVVATNGGGNKPWIRLIAIIYERTNITQQNSLRTLNIILNEKIQTSNNNKDDDDDENKRGIVNTNK